MKKLTAHLFSILVLLVMQPAFSQGKLAQAWESDTTVTTPESVLYDAKENVIYVSCINGSPQAENNKSFIAKIGIDGKIQQLKFTENLNATKGMGITNGKLYVTELTKLVEIDLKTGVVIKKYDVADAKFLNDISTDKKGNVYFTDMRSNRLWMLRKGKIEKIAEEGVLKNPNGILFDNGKLLVGNGDGKVLAYDFKTKQFTTLAEGMGGIDGLVPDGQKGYFASEWQGKIWHITPDGKPTLIHDSVEKKINTADIDYIPAKKLLLVPTFFYNRVLAFQIE
ncbi:MAG: SMP-30/gluconolactonase/LRE family protein [Verrucomicrobia bacterium]|nr:SMP-30/gluconolactonase/LRE family protein [Cytophagales bacterium]